MFRGGDTLLRLLGFLQTSTSITIVRPRSASSTVSDEEVKTVVVRKLRILLVNWSLRNRRFQQPHQNTNLIRMMEK